MKVPLPLQPRERLSGERRNLQQWLAKWPMAVALVLLASCIPPNPPSPPISEGPGSPGWSGNESSAFRSGHSDGSRDKRQGRSYNPYARQREYPARLRDEYLGGYDSGYKNANDNPWSERRAFDLGQSHGQRDRMAGLGMNPDRHADEVPQAVRDNFRRGYGTGWGLAAPGGPVRVPQAAPY